MHRRDLHRRHSSARTIFWKHLSPPTGRAEHDMRTDVQQSLLVCIHIDTLLTQSPSPTPAPPTRRPPPLCSYPSCHRSVMPAAASATGSSSYPCARAGARHHRLIERHRRFPFNGHKGQRARQIRTAVDTSQCALIARARKQRQWQSGARRRRHDVILATP